MFIGDGDSITSGFEGPTPYTSYLTLNGSWQIVNRGVPGETLATMLANASLNVDALYRSDRKNVVVIWGGTNDFFGGATVSTVYGNLQAYCAARRAAGEKVIVATMLSRAGEETQKDQYNALILSNWKTFADGVADFTGTLLGCDGCSTNQTYFNSDNIHPTELSIQTIEAPVIQAAVDALQLTF